MAFVDVCDIDVCRKVGNLLFFARLGVRNLPTRMATRALV